MKIMTCFIDSSALLAVVDQSHKDHESARSHFEQFLEKNAKIICNNTILDETVQILKSRMGNQAAIRFMSIIDESILTVNLRMDWISRRVRRSALNNFIKSNNDELHLRHFYIQETLKRKRVDIIFSFDKSLKTFGLPLLPNQ